VYTVSAYFVTLYFRADDDCENEVMKHSQNSRKAFFNLKKVQLNSIEMGTIFIVQRQSSVKSILLEVRFLFRVIPVDINWSNIINKNTS
jgi:hypothetical protein